MGRRLLFFSILRTRSAHKKLVGRSVIVLLGVTAPACEDEGPKLDLQGLQARAAASTEGTTDRRTLAPDQARRASKELEALGIEAGIEPVRDPSAPGGDLQRDVAEFTTLDACVKSHGLGDPLLGDAIDALGYDTLARDACRTLQALKAKDARLCQPISATSLRQRCETQVAVVAGEPTLCPVVSGAATIKMREPVCLARANRDERFCAAALPSDRPACVAMVHGRTNECGGDSVCARHIERFRSMLEKPLARTPFPARLHVQFTSERGKSETYDGTFDADDIAAAGAVARNVADKVRLVIGTPKTALWPSLDSPNAEPHLFLTVSVPTKPTKTPAGTRPGGAPGIALGPLDLSFDLLIPRVALLSGTTASDRRVAVQEVSGEAGSPIRMTVSTKVADGARSFRVQIDLETFVRDGDTPNGGAKKGP